MPSKNHSLHFSFPHFTDFSIFIILLLFDNQAIKIKNHFFLFFQGKLIIAFIKKLYICKQYNYS